MRKRFFRGIRVELECGHEEVLPSSWYRLSASLISVLLGYAVRRGVWCKTCKSLCQPERMNGTTRL
jgi:hypothetical protein